MGIDGGKPAIAETLPSSSLQAPLGGRTVKLLWWGEEEEMIFWKQRWEVDLIYQSWQSFRKGVAHKLSQESGSRAGQRQHIS